LKAFFLHIKLITAFIFTICVGTVQSQYKVRGTVYDASHSYPLEAVTVLSTSGTGTSTDSLGNYLIDVAEKDSIWFSYLGKPTVKYPVLKIADVAQFDISLKVEIPVLKGVTVRPRNYKQDSIQNRLDYKKVFDFRRPNVESMTSIGPNGAGIDINEVMRLFQFKKNRSTISFQQRLIEQEKDKFIDNRFNKALIRRLTNLDGEDLEQFISLYRPTFETAAYTSDYIFQLYIKESGEKFKASSKKTF